MKSLEGMPGKPPDASRIHLLVDEQQALQLLVPWEAEEEEAVEENMREDASQQLSAAF
jgi:hypothetical protein